MAPSSTPCAASRELRAAVLAARDGRQAELLRHLGAGRAVVAASLAIPGAVKEPPGALALFAWALGEVEAAVPGVRLLHAWSDALGPFAIFAAPGAPAAVKVRCLEIERSRSAARLVDLDVYSPDGAPCDRASLALPPRGCLVCHRAAHECARTRRHAPDEVVARAHALLAGV
jgi:holo-ACP synthase CitX